MIWRCAGRGLLLLTLLVLLPTSTALAHGGGTPQLIQAPAGPYEVYAWTNPTPVRAGTLHVTVAVTDPASGEPVLNVPVEVTASPASGAPIASPATHDQATIKSYYETDLEIPSEGPLQVTISFQAPQGPGEASFSVDVQPRSFTNWLVIGVAGLVLIVAGWFFWPKKKTASIP